MIRIIKSNLRIFLGRFLIFFIIGFCLVKIISVIASGEEMKIFPGSFSGDWQNPEAVFSQDLSKNAAFEYFRGNY